MPLILLSYLQEFLGNEIMYVLKQGVDTDHSFDHSVVA